MAKAIGETERRREKGKKQNRNGITPCLEQESGRYPGAGQNIAKTRLKGRGKSRPIVVDNVPMDMPPKALQQKNWRTGRVDDANYRARIEFEEARKFVTSCISCVSCLLPRRDKDDEAVEYSSGFVLT